MQSGSNGRDLLDGDQTCVKTKSRGRAGEPVNVLISTWCGDAVEFLTASGSLSR
jgi:hypothetical protein